MTDMFLEVAKSIQDTSATGTRYGKLFALRDLLSEINSLKDIKNNQVINDPFLDSM